jgi:hypothetical protein
MTKLLDIFTVVPKLTILFAVTAATSLNQTMGELLVSAGQDPAIQLLRSLAVAVWTNPLKVFVKGPKPLQQPL